VEISSAQRGDWLHRWGWLLLYAAIWPPATYGASWLRLNFANSWVLVRPSLAFAAAAALTCLLVDAAIGPHAVGHPRGFSQESTDIGGTALAAASGLLAWTLFADEVITPSAPVLVGALGLVALFAACLCPASWRRRHTGPGAVQRRPVASGAREPPLLGRKSVLIAMLTASFFSANAVTAAGTVKPATVPTPEPVPAPEPVPTPPAGARTPTPSAATAASVVSYGAVGDGITDDTAAINAAINANGGELLLFPPGRTYRIRADLGAGADHGGGIKLNQGGTTLSMHGATIAMKATSMTHYQMIDVTAADCSVLGGTLIGDVAAHVGTAGEWGYGLSIGGGADRFTATDVYVTKCWGDGFFIWERPSDVSLTNCTSEDNRRQGLSIIDAIAPRVSGGAYINNGRTKYTGPGGGIDLEPDGGTARDVIGAVVTGVSLSGNRGPGLWSSSNGRSITALITGCSAVGNGAGGLDSGFEVDGADNRTTFNSCESNGNTLDGWTIGSLVANTRLIGCSAKLNGRHAINDSGTGTQITGGHVL
jgi:hypothetical protein